MNPAEDLEERARALGLPLARLKGSPIDPEAVKAVPARYAHHYRLMPLGFEDGALTVAVADAEDVLKLDEMRVVLGREIRPALAAPAEIAEAIEAHYGVGADILDRLSGAAAPREEAPAEAARPEDASVISFVNQLLLEAHRRRATDVHLEPFRGELRVRQRVDGLLYETKIPPSIARFREAIVSRIKIMANLDIADRMLPQDGRFRLRFRDIEVDVRISTLPTPYGESVTLRLLSDLQLLDMEALGFEAGHLKLLRGLLLRPHGMLLLTGPTGSGKTTSLYAFLRELNGSDRKIITIEDPIEHELRGLTQIQVNPKPGLTFARGLRSMLRHDPDVMMVGEIRDGETAEVAIRVALTGHLVLSTLHTNEAAGAVTRLLDIGVESYLIASCLHAVIGQRLARLICPSCKKPCEPKPEELRAVGISGKPPPFFRGSGCEACGGTGYRGRTAVYELFALDTELRELVMRRAHAGELVERARKKGMRTLRACGLERAKAGLTTLEEVVRVTQAAEDDA